MLGCVAKHHTRLLACGCQCSCGGYAVSEQSCPRGCLMASRTLCSSA